ncbi:unnamed protein product [Urochloa humidicola]
MAMGRGILAVAAVAALAVQVAAAVDHKVGGSGNWDASGTNYNAWCAKQAIKQGDTMSFTYSASHDVSEVSEADYKACSGANPIKSYTGGATTVKLAAPGKRYFICSVPGHCAAGMKLEVTVAAASAPAPAAGKPKPRHQRSVAPTPAPAAMAPEPASSSSGDEMPNVSTPTAAPAPKSSDAATILGGKAVVGLAAAVAVALLAM